MEIDLLKIFSTSETPFALLFIALFFYVIRRNQKSEERLQNLLDEKITGIDQEIKILLKVWQILLEKEIKKQKEE
jgi:hypothetical protein